MSDSDASIIRSNSSQSTTFSQASTLRPPSPDFQPDEIILKELKRLLSDCPPITSQRLAIIHHILPFSLDTRLSDTIRSLDDIFPIFIKPLLSDLITGLPDLTTLETRPDICINTAGFLNESAKYVDSLTIFADATETFLEKLDEYTDEEDSDTWNPDLLSAISSSDYLLSFLFSVEALQKRLKDLIAEGQVWIRVLQCAQLNVVEAAEAAVGIANDTIDQVYRLALTGDWTVWHVIENDFLMMQLKKARFGILPPQEKASLDAMVRYLDKVRSNVLRRSAPITEALVEIRRFTASTGTYTQEFQVARSEEPDKVPFGVGSGKANGMRAIFVRDVCPAALVEPQQATVHNIEDYVWEDE